jgi:hypothetical protein
MGYALHSDNATRTGVFLARDDDKDAMHVVRDLAKGNIQHLNLTMDGSNPNSKIDIQSLDAMANKYGIMLSVNSNPRDDMWTDVLDLTNLEPNTANNDLPPQELEAMLQTIEERGVDIIPEIDIFRIEPTISNPDVKNAIPEIFQTSDQAPSFDSDTSPSPSNNSEKPSVTSTAAATAIASVAAAVAEVVMPSAPVAKTSTVSSPKEMATPQIKGQQPTQSTQVSQPVQTPSTPQAAETVQPSPVSINSSTVEASTPSRPFEMAQQPVAEPANPTSTVETPVARSADIQSQPIVTTSEPSRPIAEPVVTKVTETPIAPPPKADVILPVSAPTPEIKQAEPKLTNPALPSQNDNVVTFEKPTAIETSVVEVKQAVELKPEITPEPQVMEKPSAINAWVQQAVNDPTPPPQPQVQVQTPQPEQVPQQQPQPELVSQPQQPQPLEQIQQSQPQKIDAPAPVQQTRVNETIQVAPQQPQPVEQKSPSPEPVVQVPQPVQTQQVIQQPSPQPIVQVEQPAPQIAQPQQVQEPIKAVESVQVVTPIISEPPRVEPVVQAPQKPQPTMPNPAPQPQVVVSPPPPQITPDPTPISTSIGGPVAQEFVAPKQPVFEAQLQQKQQPQQELRGYVPPQTPTDFSQPKQPVYSETPKTDTFGLGGGQPSYAEIMEKQRADLDKGPEKTKTAKSFNDTVCDSCPTKACGTNACPIVATVAKFGIN